MTTIYRPPYSTTPNMIRLVGEIGESLERHAVSAKKVRTPHMGRGNRIRTVQASLAIENNTLSLEQVTAIFYEKIIEEVAATDQVSDQVRRMLELLEEREMGSVELMRHLGLSHRPTFRKNYLSFALSSGWVERTQPASPRSPTQRYRMTDAGRRLLARIRGRDKS